LLRREPDEQFAAAEVKNWPLDLDGCASISATAFFALTATLSWSGSLRNVVPARFNKVSQPTLFTQRASRSRSIPAVF